MNTKHEEDGYEIIFRPYRTLPDGTVIWACNYGLRAWPIKVPKKSVD